MSDCFADRLVPGRRQHRDRRRASAFTLVEMLVAMAVTLILIFALAQAYAIVGDVVSQARAAIELSGSLRSVAHRLEEDLGSLTVPVRPWADESGAHGYFEYYDGRSTDKDWNADGSPDPASETTLGDVDDILAFTSHNTSSFFTGIINGSKEQSPLAEVIWWIQESNGKRMVCRRVLLIRPELGVLQTFTVPNTSAGYSTLQQAIASFFQQNDLSMRVYWQLYNGATPVDLQTDSNINNTSYAVQVRFVANSLADLTRRENRYAHQNPFPGWSTNTPIPGPFPFPLNVSPTAVDSIYRMARSQDIIVSDALTFDAQAFDPTAPIYSDGSEALVPSDPGYVAAASAGNPVGYGAFVDLGYAVRDGLSFSSAFSAAPVSSSGLSATSYTYCTWSTHYERDGANQDDSGAAANNVQYYQGTPRDEGTDGFDSDGVNGVDDVGERETCPPYPTPLRGIQVRLRAWDPDSRQVRQASVVQDFIPE